MYDCVTHLSLSTPRTLCHNNFWWIIFIYCEKFELLKFCVSGYFIRNKQFAFILSALVRERPVTVVLAVAVQQPVSEAFSYNSNSFL